MTQWPEQLEDRVASVEVAGDQCENRYGEKWKLSFIPVCFDV
jgi:hypothetical protein